MGKFWQKIKELYREMALASHWKGLYRSLVVDYVCVKRGADLEFARLGRIIAHKQNRLARRRRQVKRLTALNRFNTRVYRYVYNELQAVSIENLNLRKKIADMQNLLEHECRDSIVVGTERYVPSHMTEPQHDR